MTGTLPAVWAASKARPWPGSSMQQRRQPGLRHVLTYNCALPACLRAQRVRACPVQRAALYVSQSASEPANTNFRLERWQDRAAIRGL